MNRTTVCVAMALVVGTAACGLLEPDPWADRQAALDASRAVWDDAGITAYVYELRRECYCALAGDFTVTVVDGVVVRAERPEHGLIPAEEFQFVETVDDLFGAVQEAIDERAFRFTVAYHPELGYPTVVDLDPIKNAIDEEVRYEATALAPVSGPD
jgi:hypothetical protein